MVHPPPTATTHMTTDLAMRTLSGNTHPIKSLQRDSSPDHLGPPMEMKIGKDGRTSPGVADWHASQVDYKRSNSVLKHVTEQSLFSSEQQIQRSITPKRVGKRFDRFGALIEKGASRAHKVCFADERPNGKTSGVILAKVYTVECFKEYNRLNDSFKTSKVSLSKDKYVEAEEYSCTCSIF